ncbi:Eco29kI family restriction endonuclease [Nesterenkonia sandarakina]|uniref:Eco29kI restriction endonuclease n=1 Tax=Nesterenkonia sandarakina TaxID=272918 RepID=A0A2T0YDP1_9MICC|nr:Eco29kI family restriction endonuclease [Nesterenkonia sandarakina]PRZ12926.1 Eco29kI restriction endonuclease [Nesterenkonia sandarakina]
MTKPFDPLDYDNLGTSIARALEEQPVTPLVNLRRFDGAGVYALYYTGDHPAYELLAKMNREHPGSWAIYIGKAEAENNRKGDPDQALKPVGPKLFSRTQKHRKSIEAAINLAVADFQVRALAVAPTWVSMAEIVAIRLHNTPVWNKVVDGFGGNAPGAGRQAGKRSRWDTLHPGRDYAENLGDRSESTSDIEQEIREYLRARL